MIRRRESSPQSLILTSHISDAHALILMLNRYAFEKNKTPFAEKYIHLFYGDGPYTWNEFVSSIYVWVPDRRLAEKLDSYARGLWSSGKWGWWILSYIFERVRREMINMREIVVRDIDATREHDGKNKLHFLCELALPSDIKVRVGGDGGDMIVTSRYDLLPTDGGYFEVKIHRVIPSIRENFIREIINTMRNRGYEEGRTLIVTLGGAEHNVFLNAIIVHMRRRSDQKQQILFDARNVFDYDRFYRDSLGKALLETHNYIAVELYTKEGLVTLSREGPGTGGIIVKASSILTPFCDDKVDYLALFGCGRNAALATKLTFARLLYDDVRNILKEDGIYYILFNNEHMENFYTKVDIVARAEAILDKLYSEEVKKAYYLVPLP